MGAGNWIVFDMAKAKFFNGGLDLDSDSLKMALFRSAAVLSASSGSIWTTIAANEISTTGGYSTHGKALAGCSVVQGASVGVRKFTHTSRVFTANAGNLTNIKYAVIVDETKGTSAGDRPLVAFALLSTSPFTVTSGNTLTVAANASGVFDVSGAMS